MSYGERQIWESSEEWVEVCGLLVTRDHGDVLTWAVAKSHVCACGPAAAMVCVVVCSFCYYQRLWLYGCTELAPTDTRKNCKGRPSTLPEQHSNGDPAGGFMVDYLQGYDGRCHERCHPFAPYALSPAAGGRVDPWVMRAEKLAQLFTGCNIQDSRSCTLPGQHSSAVE